MRVTFCRVPHNKDDNASGSTLGSPFFFLGNYLIKEWLGRRKKPQIQRPRFYIHFGFRALRGTLTVVEYYPPITENQMKKKVEQLRSVSSLGSPPTSNQPPKLGPYSHNMIVIVGS